MRLGFYTDYSADIAQFAQDTGFTSMELSAWPQSSLNADEITDERIKEIRIDLDDRDIQISALGYYPNYLAADKAEAAEYARYFRRVMQLAARMEVPAVCTFAGMTPGRTVEQCMEPWADLFSDFSLEAEDLGIRIGIENSPMLNHKDRTGENLAFSPEIWQAMFEAVPSPALGLELDPSHLVFLGIDHIQAIYDFVDRIVHFHAKDIDIDERKRSRIGFYGNAFGDIPGFGNGWWRFRAPGWGVIDWRRVITALTEVGYTGNLDIEHEDEVFAAAAMAHIDGEADIVEMLGKEPNALVLGYRCLAPMMPLDSTRLLPRLGKEPTMRIRQTIAVAAVGLLAIAGFTACSSSEDTSASGTSSTAEPATKPDRLVIRIWSGDQEKVYADTAAAKFTEATGIPIVWDTTDEAVSYAKLNQEMSSNQRPSADASFNAQQRAYTNAARGFRSTRSSYLTWRR